MSVMFYLHASTVAQNGQTTGSRKGFICFSIGLWLLWFLVHFWKAKVLNWVQSSTLLLDVTMSNTLDSDINSDINLTNFRSEFHQQLGILPFQNNKSNINVSGLVIELYVHYGPIFVLKCEEKTETLENTLFTMTAKQGETELYMVSLRQHTISTKSFMARTIKLSRLWRFVMVLIGIIHSLWIFAVCLVPSVARNNKNPLCKSTVPWLASCIGRYTTATLVLL